ncbi:TonB-dependent receptor plug domain-containing protein [Myxococcota bacterium]
MHARSALAAVLILLVTCLARAEEEVIVTATRLGSTTGVWKDRVRVISEEEIDSWSGATLADLLARASVLDVQRRGPAQADLSLRGSGFEQVLVLIDGVPVNDPQTGHHNLDLPITIDDIARIEILPGIASSIHGPGAFAGVINIVTKSGIPEEMVFRASAGSFSTHSSSFSLAANNLKPNRKLAYSARASVSLEHTVGHRPGTEATSLVLSHGATIFHPGGLTRFRLGYQDRHFGAADFYGPWPSKENTGTFLMFLSSVLGDPDNLEVLPRLSFRRHDDDFLLDRSEPTGFRSDHQTRVMGAELAFRLNKTRIGSLVLGLEHNEQEIESSTLGDHDRRRFGVFFEHGVKLARWLHMNWAVRADWGDAEFLSPSISLRIDPLKDLKILVSAARGFRLPSFTELYYSSPANQGEPSLLPEKSTAADLTVVFQAAKGITLTASGFIKRDTNLVDWIKAVETAPWKATNVGSITSGGAEVRIQIRPKHNTSLELGYTRLELSKNKPAPFSKYVFRQPVDDILLRATGPLLFGINGTLSARFRRRPETDGAILIDARLSRPLGPVNLFLEASNILDAHEEEIPGAPLPGFSLMAGMSVVH